MISFPDIDLLAYLNSVNEILQASVSQQQIISEPQNNTDKQNFAKEGLRIHKHENCEKCAFCGNEIGEKRRQLLGSYFNDEIRKLKNRIKSGIKKINTELINIQSIKVINNSDFYEKFSDRIKLLNSEIKTIKVNYKEYLEKLRSTLNEKSKNLFAKSDELKTEIPADFAEIKKNYNEIAKENNDFSDNLTAEQENAKDTLRYHEIKKALGNFKYGA
jgi:hypothetical protein